ncbi:MAG: TraB/GumN family protein [Saprospiraceae bacterium]|nr:TraB/GumN family protein [Saprospiraceae bacterium]
MKPMFLSAMASGEGSPESMKSGKTVSYELELMNNAKKQKKPISGLETMEFQMGLFDSIPYDVQAQMLVESIKVGSSGGDDLEEMTKIYKSQDIEAMQSMMSSDTEGIGRYEELLLTKRNENWIPKMKTQMKDKAVFFAVGAGHLGGKKGVIQLLEKEGYTLTPIK